jgi:hypothetical protein
VTAAAWFQQTLINTALREYVDTKRERLEPIHTRRSNWTSIRIRRRVYDSRIRRATSASTAVTTSYLSAAGNLGELQVLRVIIDDERPHRFPS